MKKMRKLISVLLTLVMVIAMAAPAFAAGEGTIKISNAVAGETYHAYKIFDLSYSGPDEDTEGEGHYAYTVSEAWKAFFEEPEDGLNYVNVDAAGYVTWKDEDTATAAAFAKAAIQYAKDHEIAPSGFATSASSGEGDKPITLTIDGLDLGYYLVDSTVGTLCSLNTTNKTAEIEEKNEEPTIEKSVKENDDFAEGTEDEAKWGEKNTAAVGEEVSYRATITFQQGAENYVMHDTMTGLTFTEGSVVVKKGEDVLEEGVGYTVVTEEGNDEWDGCSFEVRFTQEFCDSITEPTTVVVEYSGTVNSDAVIGEGGNPNTVYLGYGDNNKTVQDTTLTYVFEMDVYKYTNANGTDPSPLSGAEFELREKEDDPASALAFAKKTDAAGDEERVTYVLDQTEGEDKLTKIETNGSGKIRLEGLDEGVYYLVETKAPDGYNQLKDPIRVTIDSEGNYTYSFKGADGNYGEESGISVGYGVMVLNQTGAELPSTGGIGTTIFYIVGAILVIGAGIVLVTRKKMSHHE